jgi:hypothetical protein
MWEALVSADAAEALPYSVDHRGEVPRAEIRQFLSLDIAPNELHRIEVGGIRWKSNDSQPPVLLPQVLLHSAAAVRRQPIPNQDQFSSTELFAKLGKKGNQFLIGVAVRNNPEEQLAASSVPSIGYSGADGKLFPIESVSQYWSPPPGRPCPPNRRLLGDAAFIDKNYPCAPL